MHFMFWVFYYFFWLPTRICLPFKTYGKNNIDKKKTYIIAGNHQSVFDPVILDYVFRKRNIYLAKYELFNTKFKAYVLGNLLGGIPVNRAKGLTLSQTRQIYKILADNQDNLGIFPEGTRRDDLSQDDSIKGGVCMFAIKSQKPIIPCYIISNKFFRKRIVLIGAPFELKEFYGQKIDKELLEKADEVLKRKIIELKESYDKQLQEKKLIKQLKKEKKHKKGKEKEIIV